MDIVRENLHAVQAVYFAWQLEQMRVFDVVDRIAELYGEGLLPLGSGFAAATLRRWTASAGERATQRERAIFYAATWVRPGAVSTASSSIVSSRNTLAAHVIAEALSLDLFRIDLAAVTSQFIAETERNLNARFAAADRSGLILFFDEADALFGQRTQIDGAHDRYANDERCFLARQIEAHTGLVLLTMNRCIDTGEAFLTERLRKRYVRTIRFPRPGR